MAKYHRARSGKNAGLMVRCRAEKIPCRLGENSHEYFESSKEAERFNELLLAERFEELNVNTKEELQKLREKSFRIKQSLPVQVFNLKAVDEMGNHWEAVRVRSGGRNLPPPSDGSGSFWIVTGTDSSDYHIGVGVVPASTADEAINQMVDNERYRRKVREHKMMKDLGRNPNAL